ncbi:iron-containing alcohol dehydrogenase, partial [bacterium]|nr:iron-containing alcohol dehydrogenase [bacterium]
MTVKTKEITIRCGGSRGRYVCGKGVLGELARIRDGRPAVALVDATVARRHGDALASALGDAPRLTRPGGERIKTLAELERIYRWLAEVGLPRDGLLIGVGGGTLLDVAGLAASTWGRGVAFAAAPTTLLAAVDAAIGGKTAVNLDSLKNPIGTFHPAALVAADTRLLNTLPRHEWRNGLAEMIKAAVIGAPTLFRDLESRRDELSASVGRGDRHRTIEDAGRLPWHGWIIDAVAVKARVVAADPFERGRRRALNLGHTLGHALEPLLGL